MKKLKLFTTLSIALALAACGGGGDDEPSINASAEGFWSNTDSAILITNTGELWGVENTGSSLSLYKGNVTTNGTNFSAPLSVYMGNQQVAATASGTVKEQQTLQGSVIAAGQTSSFTLTYDATYNQIPPNLATLAGTYKDDNGATFTVANDGKFSGVVSGCTESGSINPDTSVDILPVLKDGDSYRAHASIMLGAGRLGGFLLRRGCALRSCDLGAADVLSTGQQAQSAL